MAIYWGVDSHYPADCCKCDNRQKKTFFDYVCEGTSYGYDAKQRGSMGMNAVRLPSFWGRYISGRSGLTIEEQEYLKRMNCRILPIFNQNSPRRGTHAQGVADATAALAAARALNIPKDVCIYANIETNVKADYLEAWWLTMLRGTSTGPGAADYFYRAGIYTSLDISRAYNEAWQRLSLSLIPADRFSYLWSGLRDGHVKGATLHGALSPNTYSPSPLVGSPGGTRIWQYSTNREVRYQATYQVKVLNCSRIDLNEADQAGYDAMW